MNHTMTAKDIVHAIENINLDIINQDLNTQIALFLHGGEVVMKQANYTMETYPTIKRPSTMHHGGFSHEGVPGYIFDLTTAHTAIHEIFKDFTISMTGTATGYNVSLMWFLPDINSKSAIHAEASAVWPSIAIMLAMFRAISLVSDDRFPIK